LRASSRATFNLVLFEQLPHLPAAPAVTTITILRF
jgi:hypothetical protein